MVEAARAPLPKRGRRGAQSRRDVSGRGRAPREQSRWRKENAVSAAFGALVVHGVLASGVTVAADKYTYLVQESNRGF